MMTRRKDRVVESKFAMMNNCFEKNGDTVNMIINKDDERISTYNNLEFHQVYFADR